VPVWIGPCGQVVRLSLTILLMILLSCGSAAAPGGALLRRPTYARLERGRIILTFRRSECSLTWRR
jgi:hypothetical protein